MYNRIPKNLGTIECAVEEYFSYTYLPIKFPGEHSPRYEKRLSIFYKLIGRACCDFVGEFGLDSYVKSYIYLTAKHSYQRNGYGFNRPGWHSDGFGTKDISYIWSNSQPTIFNSGDFNLSSDDTESMRQMTKQAKEENNYSFPNDSLIRMDQFSIHKVGGYENGNRAFMKLSFSEDIYALKGNSINYEIDYKWDYRERKESRNIPQSIG